MVATWLPETLYDDFYSSNERFPFIYRNMIRIISKPGFSYDDSNRDNTLIIVLNIAISVLRYLSTLFCENHKKQLSWGDLYESSRQSY